MADEAGRQQRPTSDPSRPASVRDLRSVAVPAYGPTLLGAVGSGAVMPVIAMSARDLGASVGEAAFVVALLGIGGLLGDLPAGAFAARVGERKALLAASLLELVGGIGCFFAPNLAVLGLSVLVIGVAAAVFGLARQAWLTEAVPVRLRARALSTLGGVNRIGIFLGPFIGVPVTAHWGTNAAYLVDVVASAAAFVLIWCLADITAEEPGVGQVPAPVGMRSVFESLREHRRVLLTLGVGVVFISTARASRTAAVPLWCDHLGMNASHASLVFGIAGAVDMLMFYPSGAVMDRKGRAVVAIPSMILLGLGLAVLPLASSFVPVVLVASLLGLANGIGSGLVMTLGADASPEVGRAQFLGGWRLMSDAGSAGGPALLSAIAALVPLAVACVVMGVISVAGAGWLRVWVPRYDPISRASLSRRE